MARTPEEEPKKNTLPDEDELGELADLLFKLPEGSVETDDLEYECDDG